MNASLTPNFLNQSTTYFQCSSERFELLVPCCTELPAYKYQGGLQQGSFNSTICHQKEAGIHHKVAYIIALSGPDLQVLS